MPPKFSLQTVLDVRHTRVEALEIELGELLTAQQEGLIMLASFESSLHEVFARLHQAQNGELDLFAINHLRANVRDLQARIAQVEEALRILEEKIEDKRSELVSAKQSEETLQTLKRKEIDRYKTELALYENKQQDDVYISQAFRNKQ
ncbi:MAG TPA: flagellar FliJ family protein [Anaerolineaceae bacterium]|nr:flagellar FliJ family protein [Anaerolineaceae bacterium]